MNESTLTVTVVFPDKEREVPAYIHADTIEDPRGMKFLRHQKKPIEQPGWTFMQTVDGRWFAVGGVL